MRARILSATFALLAATAANADDFNIPGTWQHKQIGNQQIFSAPGRNEGLSINPAPELARLGSPMNILNNVLAQYKQQFPGIQIFAACPLGSQQALAFMERASPQGPLRERLMVGTGNGTANIIVFWAPSKLFAAEDKMLTGGKPSCR